MRVICCHHNGVHPAAAAALREFAPDAEFVETRGPRGYCDAIASRWDGSDDLVVIEGDKEIRAPVLPAFASCPQPWCLFGYQVFPPPFTRDAVTGLGCVRFSVEAQKTVSAAEFDEGDPAWVWCPDCRGERPGCWRGLDSRIGFALMRARLMPCLHGRIVHHHEYGPDFVDGILAP